MYIHDVLQKEFPVRNSIKQKENFAQWVTKYAIEQGTEARILGNGKKKEHQNIIIGNPETAEVIYTAHYDTPRTIFFPNLMMPLNKMISFLYVVLMVVPYLLLAILTKELCLFLGSSDLVSSVIMLTVYFASFILMFRFGPVNRHNANDNTSGAATVLEMMSLLSPEGRQKTAFILFDNEEKGKLGSKAFAKEHESIKNNTLIVNLDCVANGNHFLFIAPDELQSLPLYQKLKDAQPETSAFTVHYFSRKEAAMNSDQMNFTKGVGVCACKKIPVIKFITGRIHTIRDTVANSENMDYLASWLTAFSESIAGEE